MAPTFDAPASSKDAPAPVHPFTHSGHEAYSPGAPRHVDTRPHTADRYLAHGMEIVDHSKDQPAKPLTPGDHHYTMTVDGRQRDFEIHVPKGYHGQPYPIVYMMPGMGGSIDQQKKETGMNNRNDAVIVYTQPLSKEFPNTFGLGQSTSWNLHNGSLTDQSSGYDDLNYIKQVDSVVQRQINVNKNAQYIAGFSEGGGAAQYVAEQMPGKFAAVASVHGTYLEGQQRPQQHSGTAFIDVLGTDDHMLPENGGRGFMTALLPKVSQSRPLEQATNWAAANDCNTPTVAKNSVNTTTEYSCKNGDVEQIVRQGGEHAWDGMGLSGKGDYGWPVVGMPNKTQDTTRDIMDFFNAHRKTS